MTKITYLEIYDFLEESLINGSESNLNKDFIDIFNGLYKKDFKNIGHLLRFLWFEIACFTPTKNVNGYKIGCLKDENNARMILDSYILSFIDL